MDVLGRLAHHIDEIAPAVPRLNFRMNEQMLRIYALGNYYNRNAVMYRYFGIYLPNSVQKILIERGLPQIASLEFPPAPYPAML